MKRHSGFIRWAVLALVLGLGAVWLLIGTQGGPESTEMVSADSVEKTHPLDQVETAPIEAQMSVTAEEISVGQPLAEQSPTEVAIVDDNESTKQAEFSSGDESASEADESGIIHLTAPRRDSKPYDEDRIEPFAVLPTKPSVVSVVDNSANRVAENYISPGDRVRIRFRMFSASSGDLVDTSGDAGLLVRAGMRQQGRGSGNNDEEPIDGLVPAVLAESLAQAYSGDGFDVIFPVGMADLPSQYDPDDAYVVEVDIIGRE